MKKALRIIEVIFGVICLLFSIIFFYGDFSGKWFVLFSAIYFLFISPRLISFIQKEKEKLEDEQPQPYTLPGTKLQKYDEGYKPTFNRVIIPETPRKPVPSSRYIEIKRNGAYMYFIDYLFNSKQYDIVTKEEVELEWCSEGDIIDKYVLADMPCKLIDNGTVYDVEITTPIGTECIGSVRKSHVANTNGCCVKVTGGKGYKVYENKNGDLKLGSEEFYPYKVMLVVRS